MLKLCSVTLAGGHREDKIGGAIASVDPFVDGILLVDSGESAQKAIDVVRGMVAPDRLHVVKFPLDYWDCATARNVGLEAAQQLGYDWTIACDTDERVYLNGFDLRAHLETTPFNTIQVWDLPHRYTKERCFKLPAASRFTGRVHEQYLGDAVIREALEQPRFYEIPKTKEEELASYIAVERLCREWLQDEPNALRPRYYLGDACAYLGSHSEAINHFVAYATATDQETEHGWAMFRAAQCYDQLGLYEQAVGVCTAGMRRCPYMVELHAWAAYQEMRQENLLRALAWADSAIALGRTIELPRMRPVRLGFQMLEAEYEMGWEVRRNCYGAAAAAARANGDEASAKALQAMADSADEMAKKAEALREGRAA